MDDKKKLNSAGICAAGLLIVALGLAGWAVWRHGQENPTVEVTDPVTQPEVNYKKPEKAEAPVVPAAPAKPKPIKKPPVAAAASGPAEMPEEEAAETVEPEPLEVPGLIVCPVTGQVTAAFSAEDLQYNKTLDDWRIHDGIDLSAKLGTTVLSACAGTVLSVEDDPLMGTTVKVQHKGGYETTYANLQAKPPVLEGDEVSAGQIIGSVGRTAEAEISQPPHLHFSVRKDGETVDPEAFLNP